jgi:N-acetylmuramic acid 6-phosphate etherase
LSAPNRAVQKTAVPEKRPEDTGGGDPVEAGVHIPGARAFRDSPTEQRNPRSMHLDRMPLEAAVSLMLREEERVAGVLMRHRSKIARAVRGILRAFQNGGRLFYVGAGTSGRLGVLDASECPPTFRSPEDQVQAILAGGASAVWSAVEGAEDDVSAGARAVRDRGVRAADFVVGIAASGRTPFVWAALAEAARLGARTLLICFNPAVESSARPRGAFWPEDVLAADLGPEVLTGSTRLKCGTATKLLLNVFSTLSLARSGKVLENLMVDLNPSNVKLRERAARILVQLTGSAPEEASLALHRAHWSVPRALEFLRSKRTRKRPPVKKNRTA